MGIEALQHALDRGFDQFLVVDFFDVVLTYGIKDVPKQLQLTIGFIILCSAQRGPNRRAYNASGKNGANAATEHLIHWSLIPLKPKDQPIAD